MSSGDYFDVQGIPHCEVIDRDGRTWDSKPINEIIVGYFFARLTFDQIATYLQWVYKDLLDVTSEEVQHLWESVIPNTCNFHYWEVRSRDRPEVIQMLATMKVEWNMWRDLGEEGILQELGVE